MSLLTNIGLVKFARTKIGTPYVYGCKGEVLTKEKYLTLKKIYGDLVWKSDASKIGQVCVDCSGLISWYTGVIKSSTQYKNNADEIYPIYTIQTAPIGVAVWMKGHIGIFTGYKNNVPYYIAADGSAFGVREVPLSYNNFTCWFKIDGIEYINQNEDEKNMKRYNTLEEIPDWGKETIRDLIKKQAFANVNALDLSEDMLRVLVINWRMGLYK